MRLLVNGLSTASSGGLAVLEGLGAALLSAGGGDVELLVPAEALPWMPALEGLQGLRPVTRPGTARRLWWEQTELSRTVVERKADALLGLTNTLPVARGAFRGPRALLIQNLAPLVSRARSLYPGRGRARLEVLRRLTLASVRRADVTFLFTEYGRDLVAGQLPGHRIVNVRPGLLPLPAPEATPPDEPYVVVLADLYRYKGVEDVVRAIAEPALAEVHLHVCGAPSDRAYFARLQRLAAELGVTDRFRVLGRMSRREAFTELRGAVSLIQASRVESLGLPLLEALQCGIRVVSTDIPVARELGGELVRYYRPGDVRTLADHIARLRGEPPSARWQEDASTWQASFDWQATARAMLNELGSLAR